MKIFLFSALFVMITACSQRAVYDMVHERERQLCKEQGRTDCQRADSYDKYKQQREQIIKP